MGRTIRKMSRKGYAKVAKPLLFRRMPSAASSSSVAGATRTLASSRLFLVLTLLILSAYLLGWIKILICLLWRRKSAAALRLVAQ